MRPLSKGITMMFTDVENPFGTAVFTTPGSPSTATYYKGVRLEKRPVVRALRSPKPLSTIVKHFLLTF